MSASSLNSVQMNQLRDAYAFFDKDQKGIDAKQVKAVMASMSRALSDEDAANAIKEVNTKGGDTVQFQDFVTCMVSRTLREEAGIPADQDKDLRDAFEAFAPHGTNQISAMNIRNVLATLGQTTSDDEIREMMAIIGSRTIDFTKFCQLYQDVFTGPPVEMSDFLFSFSPCIKTLISIVHGV
eukprot:g57202.t1